MAPSSPQVAPSPLDQKILEHFAGSVVRKDLTTELKQNAVVPTYVLEYLLGQHCATDDPEQIQDGLESVRRILAKHYVHRNQAELVKSTIKDRGSHKVIDKLTVSFNEKAGFHEVEFTNLGIKKVPIDDSYVKRFPKLLVGGIWAITDVEYELPVDPKASPWQIAGLKPIQVAGVDHDEFLKARAQFSTDEWMDVLMQSVGFKPEPFTRRGKLLTLIRLIPFCERNYNLLELGPKGTGKSHVFAEFSPHGMLISGSEVTAPKLFVSNANGKIGLVGYWDCICFDEFAGKDKKVDKTLVDIMKNYMANRTFSRGIEQLSAEASMVFMGNTQKSVAYMLKNSHFYEALPDKYIDSAFLDRIHAFNPGWEVQPVRHELFCTGYGFVVDYIAEVLKHLRTEDFTGLYKQHFEISSEVSTRDQTGFEKTFSGLMKIIHPDGKATPDEIGELLEFAMEYRRRVREQILRIDATFKPNDFDYKPLAGGAAVRLQTPEEKQYPQFANLRPGLVDSAGGSDPADDEQAATTTEPNTGTKEKGELSRNVAIDEVVQRVGLSDAQLTISQESNGKSFARGRIGWASSYLRTAGALIGPKRGYFALGPNANALFELGRPIKRADLTGFQQWQEHHAAKQAKSQSTPDSTSDINTEDSTPEDLIEAGVKQIKEQLVSDLLDQMKEMDPHDFEGLVLDVLAAMGYGGGSRQAMQGVPRGPDGGIDGKINEDKLGLDQIYMQAV